MRECGAGSEAIAVLLAAIAEIPLSARVRYAACTLAPVELRTLDAIHLASALSLGGDLAVVITYDHRMTSAATALGLHTAAPD